MQVASILSDLTSLRVCDHEAALALVSVAKDGPGNKTERRETKDDEGIQRAEDLLDLHYNVKMKHKLGGDDELKQARQKVDSVSRELEASNRRVMSDS